MFLIYKGHKGIQFFYDLCLFITAFLQKNK